MVVLLLYNTWIGKALYMCLYTNVCHTRVGLFKLVIPILNRVFFKHHTMEKSSQCSMTCHT